MPCFHPLKALKGRRRNVDTGKRGISFDHSDSFYDLKVPLPCGSCVGCRTDRAKSWAVRCVHEASLYEKNCFITLTFSDKYLNPKGSLVKADFQNFMKNLRRRFAPLVYVSCFVNPDTRKYNIVRKWKPWGVRYFHCGEYGSQLGRPHHHACLFNFDFPDRVLWRVKEGVRLYRSKILESIWSDPRTGESFGFCTVGDVTFESAAYVARYVVKKITGEPAPGHYQGREPEYVTMSRRPGIGKPWFDRYKSDVYPKDFVVIQGRTYKVPKYYDSYLESLSPVEYESVKADRLMRARLSPDNTPERIEAREVVAKANLATLKREYED